jgi:hypothetical protein
MAMSALRKDPLEWLVIFMFIFTALTMQGTSEGAKKAAQTRKARRSLVSGMKVNTSGGSPGTKVLPKGLSKSNPFRFITHIADAGTSEGAKKAAQTRKAGGGGGGSRGAMIASMLGNSKIQE